MEAHQHHRATDSNPEGVCPVHGIAFKGLSDKVDIIKDGVDRIEAAIGDGNVRFENLTVRLDHVEKVVYGALALGLTALHDPIVIMLHSVAVLQR